MTQPSTDTQQTATAGVVAGLAAGSLNGILTSLAAVGVSAAAGRGALAPLGASSVPTVFPLGPASRATAVSEQTYRAAYLVAAARRIQDRLDAGMSRKDAVLAERPFFAQHLDAQANRRRQAQLVDETSKRYGQMLGWRARMDDRTSAECREADGKNFLVTSRPLIGWPGTVHPHCRCRAVAPFAGVGFVDDVVTHTERRKAVA